MYGPGLYPALDTDDGKNGQPMKDKRGQPVLDRVERQEKEVQSAEDFQEECRLWDKDLEVLLRRVFAGDVAQIAYHF